MVIGSAWKCFTCGRAYTGCVAGQCPSCRHKLDLDELKDDEFLKLLQKEVDKIKNNKNRQEVIDLLSKFDNKEIMKMAKEAQKKSKDNK